MKWVLTTYPVVAEVASKAGEAGDTCTGKHSRARLILQHVQTVD